MLLKSTLIIIIFRVLLRLIKIHSITKILIFNMIILFLDNITDKFGFTV